MSPTLGYVCAVAWAVGALFAGTADARVQRFILAALLAILAEVSSLRGGRR